MSEAREELERTADHLYEELAGTLRELEARGRRAVDLRWQLTQHPLRTVAIAALGFMVVGGAVALLRGHAERRERRLWRERRKALGRAWRHPGWLALSPGASLARQNGSRAAKLFVGLLVELLAARRTRRAGRRAPQGATP